MVDNLFLKEEIDDIVKSQLIINQELDQLKNENKLKFEELIQQINILKSNISINNNVLQKLEKDNKSAVLDINKQIDAIKNTQEQVLKTFDSKLELIKGNQEKSFAELARIINTVSEDQLKKIKSLEDIQNLNLKRLFERVNLVENTVVNKTTRIDNNLENVIREIATMLTKQSESIEIKQNDALNEIQAYMHKINKSSWKRFFVMTLIVIAFALYLILGGK